MQAFAFTPAERTFLEVLLASGMRFMLVGMSAAVLQGAYAVTEDVDLWFESLDDPRLNDAARAAGGFFSKGWGLNPPRLAGVSERLHVILHMSGLGTFAEEWPNTRELVVDGLTLRLLLLPRIVASKRASGRPKDAAVMPILEVALAAIEDTERKS
jgi:hypothetical protein